MDLLLTHLVADAYTDKFDKLLNPLLGKIAMPTGNPKSVYMSKPLVLRYTEVKLKIVYLHNEAMKL